MLMEDRNINLTIKECDPIKLEVIKNLLNQYKDLFGEFNCFKANAVGVEHEINLTNETPIKQRPYPTSPREREIIAEQIEDMLAKGVIEESKSPYSSPVVLVKKRSGKYRFCADFRKLNSVTKKDNHPLPLISDLLDAFSGSHYFSILDLASCFWQIPMREQDKEKTAFITTSGI